MAIRRPSNASFYRKRQGELQFNLVNPKWETKQIQIDGDDVDLNFVDRDGCIMIEGAAAIEGTEKSDWANKIRFSLGFNDLGQILTGMRSTQSFKLVHKHPTSGHTSTFSAERGNPGSYKFTLAGRRVGDGANGFVNLFLNDPDVAILLKLVEFAAPRILGWHQI